MGFSEDLTAAQNPEQDEHIDVDVLVKGTLYTLRFRPMDGMDWSAETDRHPARPGVLIDTRYGYNLRSLVKAAAPQSGVLVVDDEERKLRVDPIVTVPRGQRPPKRVDEWADLFKVITGHEFQRISDAIWALNEYMPQKRIEAAGKARADSANSSD